MVIGNEWPATMEVSLGKWSVRVTLWWELPPIVVVPKKISWAEVVAGRPKEDDEWRARVERSMETSDGTSQNMTNSRLVDFKSVGKHNDVWTKAKFENVLKQYESTEGRAQPNMVNVMQAHRERVDSKT